MRHSYGYWWGHVPCVHAKSTPSFLLLLLSHLIYHINSFLSLWFPLILFPFLVSSFVVFSPLILPVIPSHFLSAPFPFVTSSLSFSPLSSPLLLFPFLSACLPSPFVSSPFASFPLLYMSPFI